MKTIYKKKRREMLVVPQHGYFRRLVNQFFGSLIKRQNSNGLEKKMDMVMDVLRDMGDSIEIIARQMAKKTKRRS